MMTAPRAGNAWSFGPYSIDEGERLLRRGRQVIPLEPKVADTLLALVSSSGRLLTKDELLKFVWSDSFVEENSLSRNISTLRRVLGETPDGGSYIETIPRRGYRFLAPVNAAGPATRSNEPSDGAFLAPAESPRHVEGRRSDPGLGPPRRALIALVLLMFAVGLLVWRRTTSSTPEPGESMRPVTTDAAFSTMPALAPNGALLAYASDRAGRGDLDIWLRPAGGGQPLRLTDHPADDDSPSFSPDGQLIAFRSDRDPAGIYVMPALGGEARLVVEGGRRPEFSPDGKWLAYWTGQWRGPASELPTESYVVPLTGGAPVRILDGFEVARDPIWAPNGQSLLVLARRGRGPDGLDWWCVPRDGGEPRQTHALDAPGLRTAAASAPARLELGAWTSDGVIYSYEGDLWALGISPSGVVQGRPQRLTRGAGSYQEPTVSRDGTVAFAVSEPLRVIERASLGSPEEPPVRLYADRRIGFERVTQPRNGKAIVLERFIPPASREVVVRDAAAGTEQVVIRLESTNRVNATIAPDGREVAYMLTPVGSSGSGEGFVVDIAGGMPRRICRDCAPFGFLSDSRHLLALSAQGASVQVIDGLSMETRELLQTRGPGERLDRPHISPDDRVIAFRVTRGDAQKVYVAPMPETGVAGPDTWQEIEEPTTSGRPMGWSADASVLYLFLDVDGFRCVWGQRVERASGRLDGQPFAVRHFHQTQGLGISTGFGNAVAGDAFVYEYSAPSANIWFLRRPDAR